MIGAWSWGNVSMAGAIMKRNHQGGARAAYLTQSSQGQGGLVTHP